MCIGLSRSKDGAKVHDALVNAILGFRLLGFRLRLRFNYFLGGRYMG